MNFSNSDNDQRRKYLKNECVAFRKTAETYGGLSNMAPCYPIVLGQLRFPTSEALYQCCRFPDYPDIQKKIMCQHSPMTAKAISKENILATRNDWEKERIKIMQWCLYAKLICNWNRFGNLLDSTGDKAIVEDSYKDDFWGAILVEGTYFGVNALGRLLMQTRESFRKMQGNVCIALPPPKISNFILLGESVDAVYMDLSNKATQTKLD